MGTSIVTKHSWSLLVLLLAAFALPARADEMRIGGHTRTWSAVMPPQARPLPLVLVLHGNTQQGADMRERTSWADTATRHGFVALFPDGLNRAWADLRGPDERGGGSPPAGTDDVAFLLALVDRYVAAGVADPQRIYVTGVSNGGAMTMTLACEHPERFAAAASVIMNFTPTVAAACTPKQPIPLLMMNGSADPLVPYDGGHSRMRRAGASFWSSTQTLSFWREHNGCADADAGRQELADLDHDDGSTVTRIDSRCPAGHEVVLYRVNGGGPRLPDRVADARHSGLVDALLGPQNHDIAAPELIWQFFAGHRRP
jgi:polyhydroxybutyrate depolymerase